MNSKCEKNFPVCADDIDVTVKNFTATTKEDCNKKKKPGYDNDKDDCMKSKNFAKDDCMKDKKPEYDKCKEKECIKAKVLAKVAEVEVTQPLTDTIFIPEGFFSIKKIARRVVLTQCYVVPDEMKVKYYDYYDKDKCNAHLFVEGFILKNIQYATPSCGQEEAEDDCLVMRNDYKDITAKINFNFSVPIKLENAELVGEVDDDEFAILKDCMKPCDKGTISESDCERLHSQSVRLQEPFTCELEKYDISEAVINKTKHECTDENLFDTIVEKLAIKLNIDIFQLQVKKLEMCEEKKHY